MAKKNTKTKNSSALTKNDFKREFVKLYSKIDGVEKRLDSKIDGSEKRLDLKIDGTEKRLDSKIDGVEKRLDSKIDGAEKRLDAKIEAKSDSAVQAMKEYADSRHFQLEKKIDRLEDKVINYFTLMMQDVNNHRNKLQNHEERITTIENK